MALIGRFQLTQDSDWSILTCERGGLARHCMLLLIGWFPPIRAPDWLSLTHLDANWPAFAYHWLIACWLAEPHLPRLLIGWTSPVAATDWPRLTCRGCWLVDAHLSRLLIGVDERDDERPHLSLQDWHTDAEEGVERVALLPTVGTAKRRPGGKTLLRDVYIIYTVTRLDEFIWHQWRSRAYPISHQDHSQWESAMMTQHTGKPWRAVEDVPVSHYTLLTNYFIVFNTIFKKCQTHESYTMKKWRTTTVMHHEAVTTDCSRYLQVVGSPCMRYDIATFPFLRHFLHNNILIHSDFWLETLWCNLCKRFDREGLDVGATQPHRVHINTDRVA